jgi:curved DNA-binding protein CbpA
LRDHFAALQQSCRPWVDPGQLKAVYQQLAFSEHPDRKQDERSGSKPNELAPVLAEMNEAYRVLSSPRLRLLHLLDLHATERAATAPSAIPGDLANIFMDTASLITAIDAVLRRKEQATTTLSQSLLRPELLALQQRANSQSQKLQDAYDQTLADLRQADQIWEQHRNNFDQLRDIAERFGFLDRWIAQLRENQFQLAN